MNNNFATPVTVAYGDGIGPEITEATLMIMREAGANIRVETAQIGERIYSMGGKYGIVTSGWEVLKQSKILLKAPTIFAPNPLVTDREYFEISAEIAKRFGLDAGNKEIVNMLADNEHYDWLAATKTCNENFALFETLHDAAPELAEKNIANPSSMIQAGILLLEHIGEQKTAELIKKALRRTLADGIHTADLYNRKKSTRKVGTKEFAEEVVERLTFTA